MSNFVISSPAGKKVLHSCRSAGDTLTSPPHPKSIGDSLHHLTVVRGTYYPLVQRLLIRGDLIGGECTLLFSTLLLDIR